MRKTITPCLIQKENDYFLIKFPEYPDCTLKCTDLNECLNVAPAYLSAYMLLVDQEFVTHTRPLTPKTDNKDQIFTLISCDMDEMQNILHDFKVDAKEFLNWLTIRIDEPEKLTSSELDNTIIEEDDIQQDTEHIITTNELDTQDEIINNVSDDTDEFNTMFNNIEDTENIPEVLPEPEKEVINNIEQQPSSSDKKEETLKNKIKDMDFEKKNNSGVFGVIEEQEFEFNSNTKKNTPSTISNRHQQSFNKNKNKKKKHN